VTSMYVDTSALVRAYLRDEPDHSAWRSYLFDEGMGLLSSRALSLEFPAAIAAARRARRIEGTTQIFDAFERHISVDGPISLVAITIRQIVMAWDLLEHHPLRSLDALHLSTALRAQGLFRDLLFVTCDEQQAKIGREIGLTVQTAPLA
jgi:predicted nucleic acid-binding protein